MITAPHPTRYITNRVVYALIWGIGGSMGLAEREAFAAFVSTLLPPGASRPAARDANLLNYFVALEDGEWLPWQMRVQAVEIESHKVGSPDVVIPTVDTVRHEEIIQAWLAEHKPLVLCGPPGSGKTMTLYGVLLSLSVCGLSVCVSLFVCVSVCLSVSVFLFVSNVESLLASHAPLQVQHAALVPRL